MLPNMDDGPSKDLLLRYGWATRHRDEEMLYDLVFDPAEADNLVDQAETAETAGIREALSDHLREWMETSDDPLLVSSSLAPPKGSMVNDTDGLSPNEPPQTVG